MSGIIKGQSGQPISFETKPNVNGDDVAVMANVGPVTNFDSATGTVTIPSGLEIGTRRLIRKIHPTQGTVTINCTGETFTRAGLASVTLNADGDYWLLEKVTTTRWELVDGWNTGENANGSWRRSADGLQVCHGQVNIPNTTLQPAGFWSTNTDVAWTYPVGFVRFFEVTGQINGFTFAWIGAGSGSSNGTTARVRCNASQNITAGINGRLQSTGRWYL